MAARLTASSQRAEISRLVSSSRCNLREKSGWAAQFDPAAIPRRDGREQSVSAKFVGAGETPALAYVGFFLGGRTPPRDQQTLGSQDFL